MPCNAQIGYLEAMPLFSLPVLDPWGVVCGAMDIILTFIHCRFDTWIEFAVYHAASVKLD